MNKTDQVLSAKAVPFSALLDEFDHARKVKSDESSQFDVKISQFTIRFKILGRDLANSIRRAFGNLVRDSNGSTDLLIRAWDEKACGLSHRYQFSQEDQNKKTNEILLKMSSDGRYLGEQRDQSISWLDTKNNEIICCLASAGKQYLDEKARPFHKLISTWLNNRSIQFVHAGLVHTGSSGILFTGSGGSGKSTSAVACLRAGMGYLGDDFVGVAKQEDRHVGYRLFSTGLLNVGHLERFEDLKTSAESANYEFEDKSVLYLDEIFPARHADSVTIDAIVLPRVTDLFETNYHRATKAQALLAMAPTSVMFLPRPSVQAFDALAEMVTNIPAYWLELGSRIEGIPDAVMKIAEEVSRCRAC